MAGRLEGKVAFITGVARGQGRSHAVRFAEEGADIIGVDLLEEIPGATYPGATQEDLDETVRQVEALDRRIIASKVDVRDFDALKAAVDAGVAELGRLDIVCANAGIGNAGGPAEQIAEDMWQAMIDTNLTGVWHTVKAAIPHIRAGGRGGSIAITSSEAGLRAYAYNAHYVAAKHGLVGLMRTLALELGPENIRVNTIHPTQCDTPMLQNQAVWDLFAWKQGATKEEFAKVSQSLLALPVPWVEPVDISNAILFLASDEARYITGVALPVDAGNFVK